MSSSKSNNEFMNLSISAKMVAQEKLGPKYSAKNRYVYDELPQTGHHVRFLQLAAGTPVLNPPDTGAEISEREPLSCNLVTLDLEADPAPIYNAFSYTWADEEGNMDPIKIILMNGQRVSLTENLELGLRQALKPGQNFWVDALCINQSDDSERSAQVARMKEIYQGAESVVVWLGGELEEGGSKLAFDMLRELIVARGMELWFAGICESLGQEKGFETAAHKLRAVITELFCRRYWLRSWILQELAFVSNRYIWCGQEQENIHFEEVLAACRIFITNRNFIHETFGGTSFGNLLGLLNGMGPMEIQTIDKDERVTLGKLLRRHRYRRATEPQDHIYSLLGLVTADFESSFPVDYAAPVREVFIAAAKHVFSTDNSLELLEENKYPPATPDQELYLPSWVPDWRSQTTCLRDSISAAAPGRYHASGPAPGADFQVAEFVKVEISGKLHEGLAGRGVRISTVSAVGNLMPPIDVTSLVKVMNPDFPTSFAILLEWWHMFMATERTEIIGRGSFVDLLTFGSYYVAREDVIPAGMLQWLEQTSLHAAVLVLRRYASDDTTLLPTMDDGRVVDEIAMKSAETVVWEAISRCQSRRLVVCENGAIGVASGGVGVGDQIVAIRGCGVPLVLRGMGNEGDIWKNLGDAHLEGFMEGEAMEGLDLSGEAMERFVIC